MWIVPMVLATNPVWALRMPSLAGLWMNACRNARMTWDEKVNDLKGEG
jgi:hypothetical protein